MAFEIAGGSVLGRDHYWDRKNNQDAFQIIQLPDLTVAVVCDGCGDRQQSPYSEVGAHIGARLVTVAVAKQCRMSAYANREFYGKGLNSWYFWDSVRQDILLDLHVMAKRMGDNLSRVINRYFLFTVVGVLITEGWSEFFSLGDGIIIVNGDEVRLGPFPDNTPPYLAYGLVETSLEPGLLRFQVNKTLETKDLDSFLLGTDGVEDLIGAAGRKVPGKQESVGPICRFWEDDRYFTNLFEVGRRLAVINKDYQSINWREERVERENGLLKDDTTLVVGRRRKEVE